MTEYTLIDGVERNRAYPDTFHIPAEEIRAGLVPGLLARLGFEYEGEVAEILGGERMWVLVDDVLKDGSYRGRLRNDPIYDEGELAWDSVVEFRPEHVIGVDLPEDLIDLSERLAQERADFERAVGALTGQER